MRLARDKACPVDTRSQHATPVRALRCRLSARVSCCPVLGPRTTRAYGGDPRPALGHPLLRHEEESIPPYTILYDNPTWCCGLAVPEAARAHRQVGELLAQQSPLLLGLLLLLGGSGIGSLALRRAPLPRLTLHALGDALLVHLRLRPGSLAAGVVAIAAAAHAEDER